MVDLTPAQKIAAARERMNARKAAEQVSVPDPPITLPQAVPGQSFPDEDVPQVESYERTEDDRAVDSLVDNIDILSAYIKWCGKSRPVRHGQQKEGIKVSCPNPSHPDKNPSAWLNLDKQVWYCAACDLGGDVHDIAAWHFGFPVPGYREGINFPNLRKRMAEDLGFVIRKDLGGGTTFIPPTVEAEREPEGPIAEQAAAVIDEGSNTSSETPVGTVTSISGEDEDDYDEELDYYPTLDWRSIVPEETFLSVWMNQVTVDDVAEEYHFWHGLIALGMAVGRNVTAWDTNPVFPNLFVCILGHSGSGKSKAKWLLDQLLVKALPYAETDFMPTGTKIIGTPASAEALVFAFKKETDDPNNPKGMAPALEPVRGLVDYNELASLIGRTQRLGNVLPSTLMQFYDMSDSVTTQSRTHGVDSAIMPFCSCHTTTQPKSIKRLLTEDHASSGFLNRWFFVTGKDKEKVALGSVKADVSPAVAPLQNIKGWAGVPRELLWTPEAVEAFTIFFKARIRPDQLRDKSDMLTRLDLLMKKLILLFAINDKSPSIEVKHVEQMTKMYEYVVDCYLIPSNQIGNLLQNEIQSEISRMTKEFQEKNERAMTMRDLNRWTSSKKWPADMFARTLETMIKLEILEVENVQGKRGPTTKRYRYVG